VSLGDIENNIAAGQGNPDISLPYFGDDGVTNSFLAPVT